MKIKVVPQPHQVISQGSSFQSSPDCVITTSETGRFSAELLQQAIKSSLGLDVQVVNLSDKLPSQKVIVLGIPERDEKVREICQERSIDLPDQLGQEGYLLDVSENAVLVVAKDSPGLFYGVQTLIQLVESSESGELPGLRITDWPELRYRGLHIDISRGPVLRMDYLKKVIHTMARYKLNMLTLYTEHMFAFKKHPVIGPEGGALTAEEIRELVEYAKPYNVELVGNFQSLGHFRNILKHREYRDLAETDFRWVVSPAKEETYRLLEDLYAEIVPAYESEFFNVNCDETWGLGEGASKRKAKSVGVQGVYLEHLLKLREILKKYGRRMMFWGDIVLNHPEVIPQIPRDVIVLNWTYLGRESYLERIEPFRKAGLDFFVCPGVSCWSRIFPDYVNATQNIQNFIRDGYRSGALGVLNTCWDDDGENLFEYNWYGILWGAECAWRPEATDISKFDEKFASCYFGTNGTEVTEAIKLLGSCEQVIWPKCAPGIGTDALFWEDPFIEKSPTQIEGFWKKMEDIERRTNAAKELIDRGRSQIKYHQEDIDYLVFAAERMALLARKFLLAREILSEYREIVEPSCQTTGVAEKVESWGWQLASLRAQIEDLEDDYRRLWLAGRRLYWLEVNLAKYDQLIKTLESRARRLLNWAKNYREEGKLPSVEELKRL